VPEYRGKGILKKLMWAFLHRDREMGFKKIYELDLAEFIVGD